MSRAASRAEPQAAPDGAPDPASLQALTVELPAGVDRDVHAMVSRADVCVANTALVLAGRGVAATLALPGGLEDTGAVAAVQQWLAAVPHAAPARGGGTGIGDCPPVTALGALPFDRGAPGHLVVPELLVRATAGGRWWATVVLPVPGAPDPATVAGRAGALTAPEPPSPTASTAAVPMPTLTEIPSGEGYRKAVADAVGRVDRKRLAKVVLARSVEARFASQVTAFEAVRRLRAGEPSCTVFSFPVEDAGVTGRFVGASPELLVLRRGAEIKSHPLAGTVGLDGWSGDDAVDSDNRPLDRLLASAKDRDEHRLVVDAVAAALRHRCTALAVPDVPSLVRLGSVAHLGTVLRGTLARGPDGALPSVLELLAELHPTPAVGGVPRTEALDCIASLEAEPRGHWAGPVGWVDAAGDGQWMIGIRSATVHGAVAHLTAGAGIVAGSDPQAELDETTVKLAPVLEALSPGAGRLL